MGLRRPTFEVSGRRKAQPFGCPLDRRVRPNSAAEATYWRRTAHDLAEGNAWRPPRTTWARGDFLTCVQVGALAHACNCTRGRATSGSSRPCRSTAEYCGDAQQYYQEPGKHRTRCAGRRRTDSPCKPLDRRATTRKRVDREAPAAKHFNAKPLSREARRDMHSARPRGTSARDVFMASACGA